MGSVVLEIPADVLKALRLPAVRARDELRQEFVVFLVKEGLLSRAKARELAAMERVELDDLLARRKVALDTSVEETLADAAEARRVLSDPPA